MRSSKNRVSCLDPNLFRESFVVAWQGRACVRACVPFEAWQGFINWGRHKVEVLLGGGDGPRDFTWEIIGSVTNGYEESKL